MDETWATLREVPKRTTWRGDETPLDLCLKWTAERQEAGQEWPPGEKCSVCISGRAGQRP